MIGACAWWGAFHPVWWHPPTYGREQDCWHLARKWKWVLVVVVSKVGHGDDGGEGHVGGRRVNPWGGGLWKHFLWRLIISDHLFFSSSLKQLSLSPYVKKEAGPKILVIVCMWSGLDAETCHAAEINWDINIVAKKEVWENKQTNIIVVIERWFIVAKKEVWENNQTNIIVVISFLF